MPRGGKREGAGRKAGVHNKASIERQEQVAGTGVTPLDVMLQRMRYHDRKADQALSENLRR